MNVFVSRPTWIPENCRKGLDIFIARLGDLGLIPRTLGTTDYPTKSPLDEVIKIMGQCRGAVILGYPQVQLFKGYIKDKEIEKAVLLPTEWNHIEAGLAYASNLPLLVIHHIGVCRGIFDRGALNSFLFEKNFEDPAWSTSDDLTGAIRSWRDEVLEFSPTPKEKRSGIREEIGKSQGDVWTVQGIGRKIASPKPLSSSYRESAECKIEELTNFYVRVRILASDTIVTIPLGDVTISFDDKKQRKMMQVKTA